MEKLAEEEAEKKRGLTDAILQDPTAQAMADAGRLSIVTVGDRPQAAQPPSEPVDGPKPTKKAEGPVADAAAKARWQSSRNRSRRNPPSPPSVRPSTFPCPRARKRTRPPRPRLCCDGRRDALPGPQRPWRGAACRGDTRTPGRR